MNILFVVLLVQLSVLNWEHKNRLEEISKGLQEQARIERVGIEEIRREAQREILEEVRSEAESIAENRDYFGKSHSINSEGILNRLISLLDEKIKNLKS